MFSNIPRVSHERDYQNFFDAVKDIIDTFTGRKRNSKYDRALTVRDMEKLGINMDRFLKSDKQNPYIELDEL
jgi:hypothetical protein